MLNPMQILGMMSNMKNPRQMVMNIAKQNPQMNMAMQMMGGVKEKKGKRKDAAQKAEKEEQISQGAGSAFSERKKFSKSIKNIFTNVPKCGLISLQVLYAAVRLHIPNYLQLHMGGGKV